MPHRIEAAPETPSLIQHIGNQDRTSPHEAHGTNPNPHRIKRLNDDLISGNFHEGRFFDCGSHAV
jgi:hypothetical protein